MTKLWVALLLLVACDHADDAERFLGRGAVCQGDENIYQCVKDNRPYTCVWRDDRIACYAGVAPSIKHDDTTVIYMGN